MKTRCLPLLLLLLGVTCSLCSAALLAASTHDRHGLKRWQQLDPEQLRLRSKAALVVDRFGNRLYAKDANQPRPIASLTKLMSAMVLLDAHLDMERRLTVTKDDRDLIRLTGSRLGFGAKLSRQQLLALALMSSENRAAHALARTYPGGVSAFVRAMNAKAKQLHMYHSRFVDPTGLSDHNTASATDLVRMVYAASTYPLIRSFTTRRQLDVHPYRHRGPLHYVNTNRLLRNQHWDIALSKTGYINEAGRCLVMLTQVEGREVVMVLLDAYGKLTPFGDANRTAKWLKSGIRAARRADIARDG